MENSPSLRADVKRLFGVDNFLLVSGEPELAALRPSESSEASRSEDLRASVSHMSARRGERRRRVTAALCVVCLRYVWMKPSEGRAALKSARLRERPDPPAPSSLIGCWEESGWAGGRPRGPHSVLPAAFNTLRLIVRRMGRGAAAWA